MRSREQFDTNKTNRSSKRSPLAKLLSLQVKTSIRASWRITHLSFILRPSTRELWVSQLFPSCIKSA